jgi:hypothetical protein
LRTEFNGGSSEAAQTSKTQKITEKAQQTNSSTTTATTQRPTNGQIIMNNMLSIHFNT